MRHIEHEPHVFAALSEATIAYRGEIVRRMRTDTRVPVFEVHAKGPAPGIPGGTLLVVSGAAHAPFLRSMRRAAEAGDANAVGWLLREHHAGFGKEAQRHRFEPPEDVVQRIAAVPVLTEVAYRGKAVAEGLPVVKGLEATAVSMPFAGGRVDSDGFVASHYHAGRAQTGVDVDTFVVYRQPRLTPLERKILDRLPEEDINAAVGSPDLVATWAAAAAVVAVVGAVAVGLYVAREVIREYQQRAAEREQAHGPDVLSGRPEFQVEQQLQQQADQQQQQDRQADQEADQRADGQDRQKDSGSIRGWVERLENQVALEAVDARAAVTTLVQVRAALVRERMLR